MTLILTLDEITKQNRFSVGGKAHALSRMSETGFNVPQAICISVDAYHQFVKSAGLSNDILMELYRKPFEEMRWEEI